ncbi:MAG TPA: tetratricopeptide repeat protein [Bacteroidales bacterium]|nr:tetratricopeptide repeat protein [Bacteroidales bacterium]
MKKIRLTFVRMGWLFSMAVPLWAMSGTVKDIPVTTSSKEAMQYVRQGLALMDQGDGQKAKNLFTKAIGKDPKLAIAYILRSNTADSPKEFADNLKMAKDHLTGASDWERMYYDFYATYLTSDWNQRLDIAKKIAAKFPEAARPQVDLGYTYLDGNDVTQARDAFQKAVKLNPGWTGGYYALFRTYLFNDPKDFKMAEQNATKVTMLAPSSPGAEIALGDCYRAENDLMKAKDAYSKAISLDPTMAEAYYKRGHANTFLGNYDEAKQDYRDGGKHDDNMTMSNQFVGLTYLYSGDYQGALKWFSDLASKADASGDSPDKIRIAKMNYYETYANIALHYNDADRLKEAISWMEPVSMQIGSDVGTREAALNQKGNILYWQSLLEALQGNYDLAKGKAEEIKTTLEPIQDPTKLMNYEFAMGYIHMREQHYAEAVQDFEKSNLNNIYNKYWLAKAYERSDRKSMANNLFDEIATYNFNDNGYALIRSEVKEKLAMSR